MLQAQSWQLVTVGSVCAVASCGKHYHPACVKQKPEDMQSGSGYIW